MLFIGQIYQRNKFSLIKNVTWCKTMRMLCVRFFGAGEFATYFVRPSFFGKTQPNQHRHCQLNFCLDVHIDLKNQMHETSKCCYYLEYMYLWLMVNLIDKLQSDNNDDVKILKSVTYRNVLKYWDT